MSELTLDELYARFNHLHRLVIERPLGSYGDDCTGEYFELKALLKEWL